MKDDANDTPQARRWTLGFTVVAVLLAALYRLIPPPFNSFLFGALGLWGGARLRPRLGLLLPLAAWGATEAVLYLRFGTRIFDPLVAGSFLAYGLLGLMLRNTKSPVRIGAVTVLGSVQFFLLTNFSAWLALSVPAEHLPAGQAVVVVSQGGYPVPSYARNLSGLLACYAMGLPFNNQNAPPFGFFGNLLVSDLFFTGLLFAAHAALLAAVRRRAPVPVSSGRHPGGPS